MRKWVLSLFITIMLILVINPLTAYAGENDNYVYLVLHNNTRLYQFASIASSDDLILAYLAQGTVIELLEEEKIICIATNEVYFYKVEANGIEGYILESDFYLARAEYVYDIEYKKVKSDSIYDTVKVYAYPSYDSEVLDSYKDGYKVSVIKSNFSHNGFDKIVYLEGYAYIESDNLTNGLSRNQQLAVIIVSIVAAFIALTTILLVKAHKNVKTEI